MKIKMTHFCWFSKKNKIVPIWQIVKQQEQDFKDVEARAAIARA